MDKIVIAGGKPLRGRIKINGAKNASLAVLCATFLSRNEIVLENVPEISDVRDWNYKQPRGDREVGKLRYSED